MKRSLMLLPVLALLVVTGCGASDTVAVDPVAEAATKTADTGSSRVAYRMQVAGGGQSFTMTGDGAFDYGDAKGSLIFRMDLPELGDVEMELRLLGTHMYMRLPPELTGSAFPKGKQWVGFDLQQSLDAAGLGGLDFTRQQDPTETLRYLRAASVDVRAAGTAVVRGVSTTRYVGRLDFQKALDLGLDELELDEKERERTRASMQAMLDQLGSETLPYEAFVDDEGLLRRMTLEMSLPIAGERLTMAMEMDFYDFGADVDVQAPPASQVLDVTEEVARASGG